MTACSSKSVLQLQKDSLTGQEYCVSRNPLIASKNNESGILLLKYTKNVSPEKPPIKATLFICQKGRNYHINPHETLAVVIDGCSHVLDISNSFQDPREEVNDYTVSIPSGMPLTFGSVKEVTRRSIAFFMSNKQLAKIAAAKKVFFEITSPATKHLSDSKDYPIILEFSEENIHCIQDFQNKCINNSQKGQK